MILLFLVIISFVTSAISAVFGMAGGMILMFGLAWAYPIAQAMMLHGITQFVSNAYRYWLLREHTQWSVLPGYIAGMILALIPALYFISTPDSRFVNAGLGILALLALRPPVAKMLDIHRPGRSLLCGFSISTVQFIAGASGPILDVFYVRSTQQKTQRATVATKAITQAMSHGVKVIFFWWLLWQKEFQVEDLNGQATAFLLCGVILGTRSGKGLLDRFEHKNLPAITRKILFVLGIVFLTRAGMEWMNTAP
jgi:uncharacterized membrane protein YfcA